MARNLFGSMMSAMDDEIKMEKKAEFQALRCGEPDLWDIEQKVCCDRWRLPEKCQTKDDVTVIEKLYAPEVPQNLVDFTYENALKGSCELPDTIDIYGW